MNEGKYDQWFESCPLTHRASYDEPHNESCDEIEGKLSFMEQLVGRVHTSVLRLCADYAPRVISESECITHDKERKE